MAGLAASPQAAALDDASEVGDRHGRSEKQQYRRSHVAAHDPAYLMTLRCGRFGASSGCGAGGGGSVGALSAENIMPCPFSCA